LFSWCDDYRVDAEFKFNDRYVTVKRTRAYTNIVSSVLSKAGQNARDFKYHAQAYAAWLNFSHSAK